MNRGDEEAPAHAEKESGKRKIGEVEPSGSFLKSRVAVDRFGAINALSTGKFGTLRRLEGSRVCEATEEYSRGSCASVEYNIQSTTRKHYKGAHTRPFANDSTRSKYREDLENEGTSCCPSGSGGVGPNPSSHSSVPISCTLHETTSTESDSGPPVNRFCPPLIAKHNVHGTHGEPYLAQNELVDLRRAEQYNEFEQWVSARPFPTTQSWYSVDPSRTAPLLPPPAAGFNFDRHNTLDELPRFPAMESESFDYARHSEDSNDQNRVRFNYKFASVGLEASLLQRMEARQRVQDETQEPERCGHVISPEDLVWGSVKHYCGMVLDRETNSLLGTAVLFMPQEPARQSAWVTCVQAVEGRTEVLIKNSRGGIHVAQLMLTSTALGLALFSVNVWQGTFALAFLSRVTGPASLPHRLFVDVNRSDRVYVIGYEEPWESEAATTADARVRPGRIIDAGRHTIVATDFTTGQLGGSIDCPAGFRGGLVVRADGLLAGVVTGEVLPSHRTNIDFSSAYNVYAILKEL